MTLGGLSLLEQFRPAEGYRTTAALATTYSADLMACLALLVAMDGAGSERLVYNKINALRALERLRQKVRFIAQANRVVSNGKDHRIMALFDRMVRTVPFDGRERSFHPKVILARQRGGGPADRYVLSVGSRNLTSSSAWDFGVGLVGEARASVPVGFRRLPDLQRFVHALSGLADDPKLPELFGSLDAVAWHLPAGIDRLEFRFHDGTPRVFSDTAFRALAPRDRVLLISPFLSATMVENAATHFAGATDVRLVAGTADLDRIAGTRARRFFKSDGGPLDLYSMVPAPDDPPGESEVLEEDDPEILTEPLGLHAKIFAVQDAVRSQLIVGSANLTNNAWLNKNWESLLVCAGPSELADALWEWAKKEPQVYRPPVRDSPASEPDDPVDGLRNALGAAIMHLDERQAGSPQLKCRDVPKLLAETECTLQVTRLTTPQQWAAWDVQAIEVMLPSCAPRERTSFILMRARHAESEATWIQSVNLDPPLDPGRDSEVFVSVLGVDDFLRYLESLLDETAGGNGGNGTDDDMRRKPSERHTVTGASGLFRLETLLRRLAGDRRALGELDDTVARYQDLFKRAPMTVEERVRLDRFLRVWRAVAEGMRMQ